MKKIWGWIVAALGVVTAILGFILYRKYAKDNVDSLKDALAVSKAEKDIAVLDAERVMLEEDIEERDEEIKAVDVKLEENQRKIVEARTGAKELDADGVLEEYRRLGYL